MLRLASLLVLLALPVFAQPVEIGLVTMDNEDIYWKFMNAGAQKAAKELQSQGKDVRVIWENPTGANPVEAQVQIVQNLVTRKVKGIVLAPCSSRALVPPVEAAKAAGVPTVVVNAGLESSAQLCLIATDNAKAGFMAARKLGGLIGSSGKVLVFGWFKGRASTDQRLSGFKMGMQNQHPNVAVEVNDSFANGATHEALDVAREYLKTHASEIKGIFTPNSKVTLSVLQLLKELGLAHGPIKFIGFDVTAESIAALRAGELQGFVAQNPSEMGYLGVKSIMSAAAGESPERHIEADCVMVTLENIEKPAVTALLTLPSD